MTQAANANDRCEGCMWHTKRPFRHPAGHRIWTLLMWSVCTVVASASAEIVIVGSGASLPSQLYTQASLIYTTDVNGNVTLEYSNVGSGAGLDQLRQDRVDFAGADHLQNLPSDALAVPTVAAAVVLLVNIDGVTDARPLRLDAAAIAGIFLGSIHGWDHPSLVALNPDLALPSAPVTVVARTDSSGTSSIFTAALSTLNDTASRVVGNTSRPVFPVPPNRLVETKGSVGVANAILTTANSIGYAGLSQSRLRGIPLAHYVAPNGKVLVPGPTEIEAAMVTFGEGFGAVVNEDLVAAAVRNPAKPKYPFVGYSYLVLRQSRVRANASCSARLATRDFWQWFLTSQAVSEASEALSLVRIPAFVNQQVLEVLATAFTCDVTNSSAAGVDTHVLHGFGPTAYASSMDFLHISFQSSVLVRMVYTAVNSSAAPVIFSENRLFAVHLREAEYAGLASQPGIVNAGTPLEVATIPWGAVGMCIVYHISWLDKPLVLGVETAAAIWLGDILFWDHSSILAENPDTHTQFPHTPIRVAIQTDTSDETLIVTQRFTSASAAFRQHYGGPFNKWTDLPPGAFVAADASHAAAYVATTPDSLCFLAAERAPLLAPSLPVAHMPVVTGGASHVTQYSVDAVAGCSEGALTPNAPLPEDCWPLSGRLLLSHASRFEAGACGHGLALGEFLEWAVSPKVQQLLGRAGIAPLPETVRAQVEAGLKDISCGGASLLHPLRPCTTSNLLYVVSECDAATIKQTVSFSFNPALPCVGGIDLPEPSTEDCDHVPWGSKTSVVVVVFALLAAGITTALVVWVVRHKTEEIVRYMQPTFSLILLVSATFALLGIITLIGENTDAWCLVRTWALQLPSTVTFAALYAKMYRVWRIFARQFKRVTISNKKLLRVVSFIVIPFVILLLVWSLAGPPQAVSRDEQLAFGAQRVVVECGTELPGMSLLLSTAQALLLILGLFLSFQTWNVPATVAEARPMAIAIGNIGFVSVLVLLLTSFFNAAPAAKISLRAFGVWSSMVVSVATVFGPRVWSYYRNPSVGRQRPQVMKKSESQGALHSGRARGRRQSGRSSRGSMRAHSERSGSPSSSAHSRTRSSPAVTPSAASASDRHRSRTHSDLDKDPRSSEALLASGTTRPKRVGLVHDARSAAHRAAHRAASSTAPGAGAGRVELSSRPGQGAGGGVDITQVNPLGLSDVGSASDDASLAASASV